MSAQIKRVYDDVDPGDGTRVLVDGIWPRGVSKDRVAGVWRQDLAPSREVREAFGHRTENWPSFVAAYRHELAMNDGVADLVEVASEGTLTLLFSARDMAHNQAVVLAAVINERLAGTD